MDDDFGFDFTDYTDILSDDVGQTGMDPSVGGGGGSVDWTSLFKNFGSAAKDFAGIAKGFLNPSGDLGGLPLLALAALGNRAGFFNAPTTRVGFQGTIPQYTFERQQTPIAQQRPTMTGPDGKIIPYRPGQGGISYFTPSRFVPYVPPTSGGSNDTTGGGSSDDKTVVKNAAGGYMPGGIAMLATGGYMPNGVPGGGMVSLAKGRYLKGNGDGVSDSIPAQFAGSGQKAMLADGEFVIPARVVSEIGNGSSDAGARKLYAMLDRVEAQAKKAKRGKPSGADRELKKLA